MRLCGNLAMFLLLAWLAPRDFVGGENGRKGKKDGAEDGVAFQGKFTGHARERCTWTASGVKKYTLRVTCVVMKKGKPRRRYTCEYTGEPALCASYVTKPTAFWTQVSRGLQQRKQHLCRDAHETVKVRMCKRAPAAAQFRLVRPIKEITMTTPAVITRPREDTPTTGCTQRADHRQRALEECGSAWANLCNFLFHVVQSGEC